MEYVNAGHNPPVLYNKDSHEFKYLDHGGIILGMFPEFKFESRTVTLNKNDMIFLFTDGVTETINENDDEWGDENLNQFLIKHTHLPASEISASLLKTLNTFKGKIKENYDDITYIIIKRN